MLHLHLFDRLQVKWGPAGDPVTLRPRAQRLLTYLLLHRRVRLTREQIAFTLWPDEPEAQALGALRRALSDLRAALPGPDPGGWVTATRGEMQWRPGSAYRLDVDAFETLIQAAGPTALHDATRLYAADLLQGWDEDWIRPDRERLRQMQSAALLRLVVHHRAEGDYEIALGLARRALALDPMAEAVHREHIALHYLAGDRAAALAEYERLRHLLHDELSVAPMPETQALAAAIARGGPLPPGGDLRLQTAAAPAATNPSAPGPALIGRGEEMAGLSTLWDDAAAGRGRLVVVSGEAGVGKTSLVHAFAAMVTGHGGRALIGHCYEFERALPYQAVTEMLRSAAGALPGAGLPAAHRATLAHLAPDLFVPAGGPLPEAASVDLRTQLFEALAQAFLALARAQPLLLLFEDVHWAAESTLDWLTYIAPRLGASRSLVVATCRTDEVSAEHTLARLARRFAHEGMVSTLRLQPLSRETNREWVAHLSGLAQSQADPLADRLFAETSGNPFFLKEIVRGLVEAGQIKIDRGRWMGAFVETGSGARAPLPDSLRATINARVERVTEMARMFIRAAAVAGRVFQYAIVRDAGGWADEPALAALEEVLARGFVRSSDPESGGGFAFTHHLMQEAIYADLTPPRRVYLHRRLAEAIQTLRADDFESLAYHYAQAGDRDQARDYYLRAGNRARQLVAMKEAAVHYQAALERWPESDPAGRAETLYRLGQCCWVIFDTQRALDAFESARGLYEALGDRVRAGEMERQVGRMYWELGDREAALAHFRHALDILSQGPETKELARAVSSMSQMHMLASEYDQAIAWGERALALAGRLGAEDVIVHAFNNIGVSLMYAGERSVERGLSMLRESLQRAIALGLPHDACRAYTNMNEELMGLCRYDEARAGFEAMLAYAMRVYARAFAGDAVRRLADLDWWSGRWSAVLTRWPQIVEYTWGIWQVRTSRVFSQIYNDLGRLDLARQELESTLAQAMKWGELQTTLPHLGQLARTYSALGLEPQTRQTLTQMLTLVDAPDIHWESTMPVLFACCWYAGRTDPESLAAARACLPRLERAHRLLRTAETEAALDEGSAAVALAEDRAGEAAPAFDRAAGMWERIHRPYDRARALIGLGRARAALGDPLAAPAFDQALAIFESLAAQLDDPALRQSFLESAVVGEARAGRSVPAAGEQVSR